MDRATRDQLEVLSREECLALLGTRPVGRLGVSIEALPAILPVNFCLHADRISVRTVPGTKLDAATAQTVMAFEVADYDPAGRWGWSVLVRGCRCPDNRAGRAGQGAGAAPAGLGVQGR